MTDHKQQWILLESWYSDTNPRKTFDTFLFVHGFPNTPYEMGGIYYLQICRKFLYSQRSEDPLAWVQMRMNEDRYYLQEDAADIEYFRHDTEQKTINRSLRDALNAQRYIVWFLMITNMYAIYLLNSQPTPQHWWLS